MLRGNQTCVFEVPLPEMAVSTISVPINVGTEIVRSKIDSKLPPSFGHARFNYQIGGGADQGGVSMGFGVGRAPNSVKLNGEDSTLTVSCDMGYWIHGLVLHNFHFSCGTAFHNRDDGLRSATAFLQGKFHVTTDWSLKSQLSPSVRANSKCRITGLDVDVTKHVLNVMQNVLQDASVRLESELSEKIDLRRKADSAWSFINAPIQIDKSAWLTVLPVSAGSTPIAFTDNDASVSIVLISKPEIVFNSTRPQLRSMPLPKRFNSLGGNQFHILLPVMTYGAYIDDQLEKIFSNDNVRFPIKGKRYLEFTKAQIFGNGGKMGLRLKFKGMGRGVVYLSGTPSYNSNNRTVSFPDLDFTVKSKKIIIKIADLVKHNEIRDSLRSITRLDLSEKLDNIYPKFRAALNGKFKDVELVGNLMNPELLGIYYTGDKRQEFAAYFELIGNLQVRVK